MKIFMAARVWSHGLSHPIYVPDEFEDVQILFTQGRISEACNALWQRASLGSDSAAALLGYISLRRWEMDGLDSTAITERCVEAANRNHGFAQYVVAWHAYEMGKYQEFANSLKRSALQRFLPAITDVARATVQDLRMSGGGRHIAKRSFCVAFKLGHLISALFFFKSCLNGQLGPLLRVVGILGFPVSLVLLSPIFKLCPFSIRVFSYPVGSKKPLFSS